MNPYSPKIFREVVFTDGLADVRRLADVECPAFYSKDWQIRGRFGYAGQARVDVMVKDGTIYFIKLPAYSNSVVLPIVMAFAFLNILGFVFGAIIGNSEENERREKHRAKWLRGGALVTRQYEDKVIARVPILKAKDIFEIKKKRIAFTHNGRRYVFINNKREVAKLSKTLEGSW